MKSKVISELFNPSKLMGFLNNKFCSFVIQKLLKQMSRQEKIVIKDLLVNKITKTSKKEKNKLNTFLQSVESSMNFPIE